MNKKNSAADPMPGGTVEDALYRKLEQAAGKDMDQAKACLLTITDFAYKQIFRCEDNPFTPSILDADTRDACEAAICEIKKDVAERMRKKLEPDAMEEMKEKTELLALL